MNLAEVRSHLNRINRLFSDIETNDSPPSALERDLLKEYVRKLYQATDSEPAPPAEHKASKAKPAREVGRAKQKGKSKSAALPAEAADPKPAFSFEPEPQSAPAPAKKVMPAPAIIEVPAEVEADVRRVEAQATPAQRSAPSTPVVEVEVFESPFAPEPDELSPDLQQLFMIEQGSELSDRLAGTKVSDLTRSLALNDRIEFQNTLFGGYKDEFDQALAHLNALPDYQTAVSFLGGGAAKKYDWLDEQRQGAARAFVKQVRRRYDG